LVDRFRTFPIQSFVGALVVEDLHELVEADLLLPLDNGAETSFAPRSMVNGAGETFRSRGMQPFACEEKQTASGNRC